MLTASRGRLIFVWVVVSVIIFSLYSSVTSSSVMESLGFPFTIEIEGVPIAEVENNDQDLIQATLGANAAVFTLKESRLTCGDWYLARNKSEDRSLLPKQVLWFKATADSQGRAQPVTAKKNGEVYQISFAGT